MTGTVTITTHASGERRDELRTLLLVCAVCESDDAEPSGVVGRTGGGDEAAVALRCVACSGTYLSPVPPVCDAELSPLLSETLSPRRVGRWTRKLPPDAKLIVLHSRSGEHGGRFSRNVRGADALAPEDQDLDLVLLARTLETVESPTDLLSAVAARVRPGGRVVVIVANTDGWSFRVFGGRHWAGYQYPQTRQLLNRRAILTLAQRAGLEARGAVAFSWPDIWRRSLRELLRDWRASRGLTALLSGNWGIPTLADRAVEAMARLAGGGSLLAVELEKG